MEFQSLFDELNSIEDRVATDAEKQHPLIDYHRYYDTLLELQNENYNYTEVKNKNFFESHHDKYTKQLEKYIERHKTLTDNYQWIEHAIQQGQFISDDFVNININELYKVPETIKLPSWFEHYQQEEFAKVKTQLNAFASRLFHARITETMKSERKKINKRIEQLIAEINERYQNIYDLPVLKINELQHYIEELQAYDRVIPEICYQVMHRATEYARAVVTAFLDFRQASNEYIYQ